MVHLVTPGGEQIEALALAAHVAIAFVAAQEIEHLNKAIVSRTVIDQAEGILLERFDIDADRACGVNTSVGTLQHQAVSGGQRAGAHQAVAR